MKAVDVDQHFRQVAPWVDWDDTVDRFKSGNPETVVKKIAVSWMGSLEKLKEAHRLGCNLFITHEPIFFNHFDKVGEVRLDPGFTAKRLFLQETGMAVYRCHDVWDGFPEIGVRDSWRDGLGYMDNPWVGATYHRTYRREPITLLEFARDVASRVLEIGQEAVGVWGDEKAVIRGVGLGTGYIAGLGMFRMFRDYGADVVVATEACEWQDIHWALENGLSVVTVGHAVAEAWGIRNLAKYLENAFLGTPVLHLPIERPIRFVSCSKG